MKKIFGITPHLKVIKVSKDSPLDIESIKGWYEHNLKLAKAYRKLEVTSKRVSINKFLLDLFKEYPEDEQEILTKEILDNRESALSLQLISEGYNKEIRHYIAHGDWISDFYGRDQDFLMQRVVIAGS
tara:strand:- start:324 stop:707 length:384 start_codon:yes stop_codon:yes gene_type:complete